jgi:uncharacterized protein YfkK (UPF0435 family)
MSHHITLTYDPSYPESTPSNFYSVLDETLIFSNNTEVSLTEFYYPNNYNIEAFDVHVKSPNYFPSEKNSAIEKKFSSSYTKTYSEEDEDALLLDIVPESNQIHLKNYQALIDELKKIKVVNKEVIVPDALDSKFSDYLTSFHQLCDIVDLYSPRKCKQIINTLLDNKDSIIKLIKDFNDFDNKNKLRMIGQVVYDFLNIVDNYNKPLFIEKDYTIFIQDRITSANLHNIIFKRLSSFLYTKSNHTLTIKPEITIKLKSNLVRQHGDMIIVNPHECISIAKNYLIYLDIIEAPIVFNKHDAIIKIVKPEGAFTEFISKSYDNPHYIKVNKNIVYKIQVQIKDQNHKFIDFNSGPVSLKLHFRKIKS